ncbi:hypothetical protein [Bradyrhizobium sp.]|jgi:hypothetical protein|uniref:hypothetical protein n=1 Tax=Bradyrhizobium sp. TaxID=376 RepID=UPI003C21FE94
MISARYEGVLATTKYASRVKRATPPNPAFDDDRDFESFAKIGRWRWSTPQVGYEEKYGVLSDLLRIIRTHRGDSVDEMIMTSRMPSTLRMPKEMFGDDLFLVVDVEAEARELIRLGRRFIAIREGFVRNIVEAGQNEFVLDWHQPPADVEARLAAMIIGFELAGLRTSLSTVRREEVGHE